MKYSINKFTAGALLAVAASRYWIINHKFSDRCDIIYRKPNKCMMKNIYTHRITIHK